MLSDRKSQNLGLRTKKDPTGPTPQHTRAVLALLHVPPTDRHQTHPHQLSGAAIHGAAEGVAGEAERALTFTLGQHVHQQVRWQARKKLGAWHIFLCHCGDPRVDCGQAGRGRQAGRQSGRGWQSAVGPHSQAD